MICQASPGGLRVIRGKQVRVVAVTPKKGRPGMPGWPTITESGLPGYESRGWLAVMAPAGTPAPIVERLNAELVRIATMPDMKARLVDLGLDVVAGTPAALGQFIQTEIQSYRELVAATKITLD